ncbi:MAG: hypothetical protein U0R50_15080 [Gaiellales bacterium]
MSELYEIGVSLGLGVAGGLLFAGVLAPRRGGLVAAVVGAAAVGLVAGLLIRGWLDVPGAMVGAVLGAVSAALVVRGAIRRGAGSGATALLLAAAAVVIGALSFVPVVGYLIAGGAPAVAIRKARSEPERYAGLRTLAK